MTKYYGTLKSLTTRRPVISRPVPLYLQCIQRQEAIVRQEQTRRLKLLGQFGWTTLGGRIREFPAPGLKGAASTDVGLKLGLVLYLSLEFVQLCVHLHVCDQGVQRRDTPVTEGANLHICLQSVII